MGPGDLKDLLTGIDWGRSDKIIVGMDRPDDASVYDLGDGRCLVQTVDFFPPIVDDPYTYGRIAAVNALSDIYAMLAMPIMAHNILVLPPDGITERWGRDVVRGGAAVAAEAGVPIVGGHSIQGPEPVFGLFVTGLVARERLGTKAGARDGDWLVLSKPVGTGILTTALKSGDASIDELAPALVSMQTLNRAAAEVLGQTQCRSCTDVTGFGLLGHLREMLPGDLDAELWAESVPRFPRVLELAREECCPGGTRRNLEAVESVLACGPGVDAGWLRVLADPQTAGGLLATVHDADLERVLAARGPGLEGGFAVVGRWVAGDGRIRVMLRHDGPETARAGATRVSE